MQTVISILSGFFVVQMIFGLFFAQFGLEASAFRAFFDGVDTVPLIVLSIGQWIQVASLILVLIFLANTHPYRFLFPRFVGSGIGADNMEAPRLTLLWEWISVGIILILPLVGIAYWWLKFFDADRGAWIKNTNQVVGIFERVPGCHFFDNWDVCRYGKLPATTGAGDSFVPFWQPVLIMGGGTLVVIALTVWVLCRVVKRAPIRRMEILTKPS